ncbi:SigE family RNA polymerase sigma factor [Kitasatospora fiedleri]|uniref:hypothetical protein n=1 Tax=Kitasatospora fiedleri TaxID=2991545 RepID=UPI00249B0526|nr:hypothetical protein [Kitasatospora fiedleri]
MAEDLVQEALERACRQWRKVAVADSPEAYVRKVLVKPGQTTAGGGCRAGASAPGCRGCPRRPTPGTGSGRWICARN